MPTRPRLAAFAAGLALLTLTLHAQVPQWITYQSRIAVGTVNFDGCGEFSASVRRHIPRNHRIVKRPVGLAIPFLPARQTKITAFIS